MVLQAGACVENVLSPCTSSSRALSRCREPEWDCRRSRERVAGSTRTMSSMPPAEKAQVKKKCSNKYKEALTPAKGIKKTRNQLDTTEFKTAHLIDGTVHNGRRAIAAPHEGQVLSDGELGVGQAGAGQVLQPAPLDAHLHVHQVQHLRGEESRFSPRGVSTRRKAVDTICNVLGKC